MSESESRQQSLVTVPFATGELPSVVSEEYRAYLDSHDPEDVLVLTSSPTSAGTFRDLLADDVPGAAVPRVASLVVQATDVVKRTDDRSILSDALRRELVARFLEDREWDDPYLERAAELPSYRRAIGQLMETAAWQDRTFEASSTLAAIGEALADFHGWLAEHDHIERGQLLTEATRAVADRSQSTGTENVLDVAAILAVEFEEYFPVERRFLEALADGRDVTCVAERDASIRRTRIESGPVEERTSTRPEERSTEQDPSTRPAAVAAYLARGDVHADPGSGSVDVLTASTQSDQIEQVVDEIERLRTEFGWEYDDVAVVTRRSGAVLPETIRALERSGIPTESATVIGFGDDPAVRQLLAVARALAASEAERETRCRDSPVLDSSTLKSIAEMDGLEDPLRRWATESGLKEWIAEETHPLDARSQFGNVRRVFRLASFVEETAFLEADWETFAELLERAHEYAPATNQTSATERSGGVQVDHVRAARNGNYRAVFAVNVVDQTYPGDLYLSDLFPSTRVAEMPEYPAVTDPTGDEVDATFDTSSSASHRALRRYYVEHARRELAVSAAAATDRLYFCLYEYEDSALEERAQPSRFLRSTFLELPWLADLAVEGPGAASDRDMPPIRNERAAERFALSRVDRTLHDVRRCTSQDLTVSLDDLERDLVEVRDLLDASGERGERLRDALRARMDVKRGRICRE